MLDFSISDTFKYVVTVLVAFSLAACDRPPSQANSTEDRAHSTNAKDGIVENTAEPEKRQKIPSPSFKLLELATAATVCLGSDDFDGSGVVIHQNKNDVYILTVAHAVEEGINRVEFFSIESINDPVLTVRSVKVVSQDKRSDLAIIKVDVRDDTNITIVRVADKNDRPDFGYSVGCGNGEPPLVLSERISGEGESRIGLPGGVIKRDMWQTENAQQQGRSGGPLLNVKGDLLGVALGKYKQNGYYAHLREISRYLIDNDLAALVTCAESTREPTIPQGKNR